MDAVYDFAIDSAAAEARKEGVVFRFMPDAKEVHSALQVTNIPSLSTSTGHRTHSACVGARQCACAGLVACRRHRV